MPVRLIEGEEPVPGYVLESRLGRGGFGEVWKAIAPGGIPVALKFIETDGGAAQVEERALRIVCRLRHPHLLEMHWAQRIDDRLVIATSLCDNNLSNRLKECREQGLTGIPRDELLNYIEQAAQALDYLNCPQHLDDGGKVVGIQHRDIKPANIFLLSGSVKVADFGLAKILELSSAGHSGSMTPHYAPPEMFHGKITDRSDQYSLAVTYCEMQSGKLPFSGNSITQLMYAIVNAEPDLGVLPEEQRPIVARALSKDPAARWENCLAFARSLRTLQPVPAPLTGETVASIPIGDGATSTGAVVDSSDQITVVPNETQPQARPAATKSRKFPLAISLGVGAILLLGLFGRSLFKSQPTEPQNSEFSSEEQTPSEGKDSPQTDQPQEVSPSTSATATTKAAAVDPIVGRWKLTMDKLTFIVDFRSNGTSVTIVPLATLIELRKRKRPPPKNNPAEGKWARAADGNYLLIFNNGPSGKVTVNGDRLLGKSPSGVFLVGQKQEDP